MYYIIMKVYNELEEYSLMKRINSNTAKIKNVNKENVRIMLKSNKVATKLMVAQATGLSITTCGTILNELVQDGEVFQNNVLESNGGRPANEYVYNADFAYVTGIYLRAEKGKGILRYVVANAVGEIVIDESRDYTEVVYETISQLIGDLLKTYPQMKAVVIGVPGIVYEGIITDCEIRALNGIAMSQQLKEKYKIDITIENDICTITYGFYNRQNFKTAKNVAVIYFSEDNYPGAGFAINGYVVKGNTMFSGEISYLSFVEDRVNYGKELKNREKLVDYAGKTAQDIAVIVDPVLIAFVGGAVREEDLGKIRKRFAAKIPLKHIPQIIVDDNIYEDYVNGLIELALQKLNYKVELVIN